MLHAKKSTAKLKLIDNLIVSPYTQTVCMASSAEWLDYRNRKLLACSSEWLSAYWSLSEWLVSNVATGILIRTYNFRTASKTLPPLRIFVSRNPWYPFAEPSSKNTGLRNCSLNCGLWTTAGISLYFFFFWPQSTGTHYHRSTQSVCIQKLPSSSLIWCPDILTYFLHGAESFFVKLTGFQLVKKFPAFYGTRRFITAFTSPRHLFLSWGCPVYSKQISRSAFPKILDTEHVLT